MYDKKEPDFTTLIHACKQNNRIVPEQLYELLFGRMMGLTMRSAKDREEAKFILNLAFLKVFRHLALLLFVFLFLLFRCCNPSGYRFSLLLLCHLAYKSA